MLRCLVFYIIPIINYIQYHVSDLKRKNELLNLAYINLIDQEMNYSCIQRDYEYWVSNG